MMKNKELISILNNCIAHCHNCADACLDEDDVKMMVKCIRLDRACAEICRAAVSLLAMNSAHAGELIKACANMCDKCADECAQHEDQHCKDCAEACRKCADACRNYAA